MITCEDIQTQKHHPFTALVRHACPAGAKPSCKAKPACSTVTSLCPSTSPGEGNVTQSRSFLPCSLLAAGEVDFPCAWVVAGDKEHLSGSCPCPGFCADQGQLEYIGLILTLNTDPGSRKLLLGPYKRKNRFIDFLIYAALGSYILKMK